MNKCILITFCVLILNGVKSQADLVSYWPLNDGAGQVVNDASGNGYDGILGATNNVESSDPSWVVDSVRGVVLEWDGDDAPDQWVDLTASVTNFASLNKGTITAWVKIVGEDTVDVILAASDSGDASSELRFFYEESLKFDIRDDSSESFYEAELISSSANIGDDTWHFIAITVDSDNNAVLYVDGDAVSSGKEPFFSSVLSLDQMALGRNKDNGGTQWVFKGRMSDVAVFDEPLSSEKILALYNGTNILDVYKEAFSPEPSDGIYHIDDSIVLTWQSNASIPEYTVYFDVDPEFTSGPIATNLTSPSYTPGNLDLGNTYYWRVDVIDNGISYEGKVWSFTTIGKAGDPVPYNGAEGISQDIVLSWTGDSEIASYDIYFAEEGDPLTFIANTSVAQFDPLLNEFTSYSWRIDAKDVAGNVVSIGDVWTFKTQAQGAFFEEVDIFVKGSEGYAYYRIPSIIKAPNGDLLAFCEGRKTSLSDAGDIDIVMKRSMDNGNTWGSLELVYEEGGNALITIGNPCPVVDRSNGRIWMPFCRNSIQVYVGYSDDNGYTWSARREITQDVKPEEWTWYATGPGVGIQLENGQYSGRLVIPSDHRYGEYGSHMMYSDDHGVTWTYSDRILPGCNECQAVELSDGTVMNNARTYSVNPDFRGISTSTDGGQTWSELWFDTELPEPTCQASFLRYTYDDEDEKNRLLFTNPNSISDRVNLTVKLSYDEAETWPVSKQIYSGVSAYSCLVILSDKSIGCLYEKGGYAKITFAHFSLEWITDGKDSLSFCSSPLIGDINGDCSVNIDDIVLMSEHWLECNLIPQSKCP